MHLILWRHAEAEAGIDDMQRQLTDHGRKQAERSSAWLRRRLTDDARILVSPAVRALQTADALGRPYDTVPEIEPGADAQDILEAANWPMGGGMVVVVGHQPTLGRVAAVLMTGSPLQWSVRKSGIWWLSSRERDDETQIVVRSVINPEFLD